MLDCDVVVKRGLIFTAAYRFMKKRLAEIDFDNQRNPNSFFDIVKVEDLMQRSLDHDIAENHLVKFFIIFFVYEGKGKHTIDFVDYPYEDGTVFLIRKGQIQKFSRNKNVRGYLLVFTEEFIISHLNQLEASKTLQLFNDSLSFPKIGFNDKAEFKDFTVLIKHMEMEFNIVDDFSIGITRSVLHIVITKLFRIKGKNGVFVKIRKYMPQFLQFQELVERNCLESRKVSYYAGMLNVSTKTLNNIVNQVVNSSAKTFIDERAIMQAKRLLINTELSVKEIAYRFGFGDPSNFIKYFRNHTGTSPESFRSVH